MPCNGTATLTWVVRSMETLHKHPALARACPTSVSRFLAKKPKASSSQLHAKPLPGNKHSTWAPGTNSQLMYN